MEYCDVVWVGFGEDEGGEREKEEEEERVCHVVAYEDEEEEGVCILRVWCGVKT